jgi:MFS superfamily sulfate permease-like transporter
MLSGFIVFLIALPLSLGIALASGAPAIAGIITAIVGGVLVSLLSGSHVTINGPAAGLIVIVLGAIEALGEGDPLAGYRYALAVGVACGAIQIVLGLLKAGKMTNFFPLSVVHGMLAGIGVIIMARQIHVALGVTLDPAQSAIPHEWPVLHGLNPILAIPSSLANYSLYPAIIGLVAVLIMVLWPKLTKVAKFIPAPLIAAIAGVILGTVFDLAETNPRLLLDLPEGGLLGGLTTPRRSSLVRPFDGSLPSRLWRVWSRC